MDTERYVAAVRAAAHLVDVPGAPRSLRLDGVTVSVDTSRGADRVLLSWSFEDPLTFEGDREPHRRRVRGVFDAGPAEGEPVARARAWWAGAQLQAAHRFVLQVDADWLPGEPAVALAWTRQQAWAALLEFPAHQHAEVEVHAGEIRVDDTHERLTYSIDPDDWAAYLNRPYASQAPEDPYVVAAAVPVIDGLPLWAVDELSEAAGSSGTGVVGLVGGELVDLEPAED